MKYNFTDGELKEILKKIIITIDTREQANQHIIDFLEKKKIAYTVEKLSFGDYSLKLPKGSFEGQTRDISFENNIVIERKGNIDELAGNLKDDTRILKELAHLNKYNIKYFIFVEDEKFDDNLRQGKYRSQYHPVSLYARLKTIEARYNTIIRPVSKENIGSEILNTLKYTCREILKNGKMEEFNE